MNWGGEIPLTFQGTEHFPDGFMSLVTCEHKIKSIFLLFLVFLRIIQGVCAV